MTQNHPKKSQFELVRNIFYSGVSGSSSVLLLAILILAGRWLGDSEFGKFSFALALASIFSIFLDFGLKEVTIRSVARNQRSANKFLGNTFAFKFFLSLLMMIGLFFTARLLREEHDVRIICYLLGIAIVLRSYLLTLRCVLQGLEKFALESFVMVSERMFMLLFVVVALMRGYGIFGVAVAFIIARVVALVLNCTITYGKVGSFRPRFDTKFWHRMQVDAIPFGVFLVVISLYSYFDTIMLGVFRGNAETGIYNAAYRVYEGLAFVPLIIQKVLTPRLSKYFIVNRSHHLRLANTGTLFTFLLVLPFGGLVFVSARYLIVLFFGAAYISSKGILQILIVGLIFVYPLWILNSIAISINKEKYLLKSSVVGLFVNLILNFALIPYYGMYGAALATVVAEMANFIILFADLYTQGFFQITQKRSNYKPSIT